MADIVSVVLLIIILFVLVLPAFFVVYAYFVDRNQKRHSVLRNYPVLGRIRYMFEKIGPELRQYFFRDDTEGKPFSRKDYHDIIIPAKYGHRLIGYGSLRDFEEPGYYVKNSMFPKQLEELALGESPQVSSFVYQIDKDSLIGRKEHREDKMMNPFLLEEEYEVVIGENTRNPFHVKGHIGMSAMSYGALGDRAITALSIGLGRATGTWMNTGEGGLSNHHLKGDVDLIMQIGPGLFGGRAAAGEFSWEELKKKAEIDQVKAFELKLAQGAKLRGGHVEGDKVTPEIAKIRNVEPYKTINSPNRFYEFDDVQTLLDFLTDIREATGLPVGMKIVVGQEKYVEELAKLMRETGKHPDFITVDGGEGGTGATYQELADSVGLPLKSALRILHQALVKEGVRDRVKIIASGKLITPDKIAIALSLGADLVQVARAFMVTVGCIMAQVCHTNECPVGVATTDPKLQRALDIDEKSYRVTNFVVAMREGLFNLAAASGLESPSEFRDEHVAYKDLYDVTYDNHLKTNQS